MKTGNDIKTLEDIRMLVTYLCITQTRFSKEEIFDLAKEHMQGSSIIVNKLLKTLINQVVGFLMKNHIIAEDNGQYYQLANKNETMKHNSISDL